jgi:hypothetical protein
MPDFRYTKLEIFIPESHLPALQEALRSVDAGHIGNYDCCLSCSPVTSFWRPLKGRGCLINGSPEIGKNDDSRLLRKSRLSAYN